MPLALCTSFLFALTAVCATQATKALGSNRANLFRLIIAVVLLGLWAHVLGQGLGGGALGTFILAGAIGFGGGGWCMFQAFPRIGSTLSLLVVECAATLSSAALAWIVLGAALSPIQIACALLAISGVVLGLVPFQLPELPRRQLLVGAAFAAVASMAQGASWTLSKAAFMQLQREDIALDGLTAAYQRLLGGVAVAAVIYAAAALRKSRQNDPVINDPKLSGRGIAWSAGNALTGPVLGVGCMLWAIREVGNPGLVQAVVATATLLSVPFARRLERRTLRWPFFIGTTLSILGVAGLLLLNP